MSEFTALEKFQQAPSPLQEVVHPVVEKAGVQLLVKRDDLIDPFLSGNKWRKLKYNLRQAQAEGKKTLLTFGGAYSNHIFSVAAAGKKGGFGTLGIIRGEEHLPLNSTLSFAKECGMQLHYLDRASYRQKDQPKTIALLKELFGDFYLIPEGGTNALAVKGAAEIMTELETVDFDLICCACGTGGTLAGIVSGLKPNQKAMGFSVLKGGGFLKEEVEKWLSPELLRKQLFFSIQTDYHFGGYAKKKAELIAFMEHFSAQTTIPLEYVYTGKLFFGVIDLIEKGYFPRGSKTIAVHTGGLQLNHPAWSGTSK